MTLVRRNSIPTNYWNNDFVSLMNSFLNDDLYESANTFKPAVNIQETDEKFEMEFQVPGMNKEDFRIKFEDGRLEVSAEMEESTADENDKFIRREFSKRAFKRNFRIAENIVDSDKIVANYKDGILTLTLPKREEAKPEPAKEIAIS